MKKILFVIVSIILIWCVNADSATINASCTVASIRSAIDAAVNGDVIQLPDCSVTLDESISINKSITIRGNGTSTVFNSTTPSLIQFFMTNNSRITNMKFNYTGTSIRTAPFIQASGTRWRIDNCTITAQDSSAGGGYGIYAKGYSYGNCSSGLIDNNIFYNQRIYVDCTSSIQGQHDCFAYDEPLGTSNAVYIEDNTFTKTTFGNVIDGQRGGRAVVRYNTLTDGQVMFHGRGANTYERAIRYWEIYGNTWYGVSGNSEPPTQLRSGTGVLFNNTVNGAWGWSSNLLITSDRSNGGYGILCNGTSPIDNNDLANGYICRDQAGAGRDVARTVATGNWVSGEGWVGTVAWQKQTSAPIYAWNNNKSVVVHGTTGATVWDHIVENRDFYDAYPNGAQTSKTSPFNGTTSMGYGTYANRPDTCTTNVGYWATDRGGNWNTANDDANDGALYKCTSTNVWTLFYVPYTYPHPLRSGEAPPEDTQAPYISSTTSSQIACDAESPVNVTLSASTNENAYCRYSTSDVAYLLMTEFTTSGSTSHSSTISLACDASYTYYVRCQDRSPNLNTNTTSTSVAFTITPAEAETGAPVISNARPSGVLTCTANPRTVTLAVTATDEQAMTCRYSTTNQAYAAMPAGQTLAGDSTTFVQGVDDSYETMASTAYRELDSTRATEVGVSFTSQGGELDTVRFRLAKYGSPTGNATVKIYAHSGTYGTNSVPTGDALATSDNFDVSTLTTDQQWRTFTFSGANRITLVDDTYYVATVAYSGGNATNYVRFYRDNTTLGHDGNECYYQSGSWSVSTTRDPIFTVYTMQPSSSGASGDFTKDLSLACGSVYDYYVACTDGTTASDPTHISFGISGTSCQESGCIEFEDCTNASPMLEYADATASGTAYVSTTTNFQGTSTCAVTVAAGTYRLYARTMAADTGEDSVYLTIDSQDMVMLGMNPSQTASLWNVWNLDTMKYLTAGSNWQDYQFTLTGADPHSFVFTGREAGAKLDYFYLFPVDVPPPNPPVGGATRFMIGTGQTMVISPTTGGCQVIIE